MTTGCLPLAPPTPLFLSLGLLHPESVSSAGVLPTLLSHHSQVSLNSEVLRNLQCHQPHLMAGLAFLCLFVYLLRKRIYMHGLSVGWMIRKTCFQEGSNYRDT